MSFKHQNQKCNCSGAKRERPMTETLIKLLRAKGEIRIDALDVKMIHEDGSITIAMPMDQMLMMSLLAYTESSDLKERKKFAQMVAERVLNYPMHKSKS